MADKETCRRCGWDFLVKFEKRPKQCPNRNCRSRTWDKDEPGKAGRPRIHPEGQRRPQARRKAIVSVVEAPEVKAAVQAVVSQDVVPREPERVREIKMVRDEDEVWSGEGEGF